MKLEELGFSFSFSGFEDVSPHAEKKIRKNESIAAIIPIVRSDVVLEIVSWSPDGNNSNILQQILNK